MACSVTQFEQVKLSYLNNPSKIEDPEQTFTVEVRRMSQEAQITISKKSGMLKSLLLCIFIVLYTDEHKDSTE